MSYGSFDDWSREFLVLFPVRYAGFGNDCSMSILCRQVSLAELSANARAHRRRWQSGVEVAAIAHYNTPLGVIVPLEIFAALPVEVVSGMPLRELQPWLFQNQQGWRDGIMDGLTLTWHRRDILGFVHPRLTHRLPLQIVRARDCQNVKSSPAFSPREW
jgi:hypothetical protein